MSKRKKKQESTTISNPNSGTLVVKCNDVIKKNEVVNVLSPFRIEMVGEKKKKTKKES